LGKKDFPNSLIDGVENVMEGQTWRKTRQRASHKQVLKT